MDAGNWITIGVVLASTIISAVGQVMYFKGEFATKIQTNAKDIKDLEHNLELHKGEVRYKDVCDAIHSEANRRFDRLEKTANGRLGA